MTQVELVAIGTELLLGKRVDTNTAYLARELARYDFDVVRKTSIADREPDLTEALTAAWQRSTLVFTCGGLGPTVDDITREALVRVTGIELYEEAGVIRMMQERFARRGRTMRDNNRRQALVPRQGRWFPNHQGTAPGLCFEQGDKTLIALPGPPHEFRGLVQDCVLAYLTGRYAQTEHLVYKTLRFAGVPESTLDHELQPLLADYPGLDLSLLPDLGVIELTLSRRCPVEQDADAALDAAIQAVRDHFGAAVFAEGDTSLAAALGDVLRRQGCTLAVAESCTGGLIGAELTATSGSSAYFVGGLQVYSNEAKQALAGVRDATLQAHGAVSEATARELACGVRQRFNSDYAVSVTGIAGPDGGTDEKPVGTVYIGAVGPQGEPVVEQHCFPGDRNEVRRRSVVAALLLVYRLATTRNVSACCGG